MGSSGMYTQVLRELAYAIAKPLSTILEKSQRKEEMPDDERKASVTPIFKKGNKDDPGNYCQPPSLQR